MGDRHRAILALGNRFYGIGSMKSKQHCAAAIHLQVEMADGNIVAGGEEEFNTAVLPDLALLMFGGYGPNITVHNAKNEIQGIIVVGDFYRRMRKMFGSLRTARSMALPQALPDG